MPIEIRRTPGLISHTISNAETEYIYIIGRYISTIYPIVAGYFWVWTHQCNIYYIYISFYFFVVSVSFS